MKKIDINLKPTKGLEEWAHDLYESRFIYYRNHGCYAECFCSECGKKYMIRTRTTGDPFEDDCVDIEKPKRDFKTKCRECGTKAIYKPAGRTKSEYHFIHIITGQKISDEKFAFVSWYSYQKTLAGHETYYGLNPEHLIICEKGRPPKHSIWNNLYGWVDGCSGINYSYIAHPSTFREIKKTKMFKYVPVPERLSGKYYGDSWVTDFYIAASRYPDFEMLIKLGLDDYWERLMNKCSTFINPRGKTIEDRLRIYKSRLKDLIEVKGDHNKLFLFQLERKLGAHWTDEDISIIETLKCNNYDDKYKIILKYASPVRVKNYMTKQKMWPKDKDSWQTSSDKSSARRSYYDYIAMREAAGYEMNDIQVFPNDFRRRHDEMVLETEKAKADARKKQALERFPKIKSKYRRLSDKYSAAAGGYIIRPAKDAAEIVTEGRVLHHCVGGDNYLSSHNNGRSFILFLRKISKKDIPYITVEIRGNEIIQWYGAYDKKPDKKLIDAWLDTYCKELVKREKTSKKASCTGATKSRRTA